MNKFLVIDGNSLVHRAFWALPLLSNSEGMFTNAVFGFSNMLFKVIEDEKPDYLGVAFDLGRPKFRLEAFPEYKGHRKKTPDELRPQFSIVKELLRTLEIPIFELEGYEADDLIGTLATRAEAEGIYTLVLTGDKDSLQLVSSATEALIVRKGISDLERYTPKKLEELYGLSPQQIVDLKGLMGDSSDNIPGIPGVGEKTALKLLKDFGTVEELVSNFDKVSGKKLQEKIEHNRDLALVSKKLAMICREAPIEVDWTNLKLTEPNWQEVFTLASRLEFKSLIQKAEAKMGQTPEVSEVNEELEVLDEAQIINISQAEELEELLEANKDRVILVFPWVQEGILRSIALKDSKDVVYILSELALKDTQLLKALEQFLQDKTKKKVAYHGKELIWLFHKQGIIVKGFEGDVTVANYLLNPIKGQMDLLAMAKEYLPANKFPELSEASLGFWCDGLWQVYEKQVVLLEEFDLYGLYKDIELPLVEILADMELTGIKVDGEKLKAMSEELGLILDQLSSDIYQLVGQEFNINSPKQLGVILFETLGLPPVKKTKTGYSTSVEVLEALKDQHPVIEKLMEFRHLSKLKSTYLDGLRPLINPETGRIHTTFNQNITATGRLSSTEPNLQNIPIRLDVGRRVRGVFAAEEPDYYLLSADYSQIELRILAHISGDENLIEAFKRGQDIHTRTASEVFQVPMEEVTSELRGRAKAINFGIVYGLSDFGLSQDLKIPRKEAKAYIDNYFLRYPGVKAYINNIIEEARGQGYVTTLFKRRRYIPDVLSSNHNIRSFGERTAMNTPIQGTAADIIKLAMVKISETMEKQQVKSRMLLQVHDELIFEVHSSEKELMIDLVTKGMAQACELSIPLIVDAKWGRNWYDMEKI